jgi:hypothetical protein
MNDDLRYLHKWLNEEQTAPIDRVALARMLALMEDLGNSLRLLEAFAEILEGVDGADGLVVVIPLSIANLCGAALAKYREFAK